MTDQSEQAPLSATQRPSLVQSPISLLMLAAGEMILLPTGFLIRHFFPIQEGSERTFIWRPETDVSALIFGCLVGVGLFLIYLASARSTWEPMTRIRNFLTQTLGEALRKGRLWHFVLVGCSAGVCEEYFFRGVLEPRLGFLISNLIFALLHPHSLFYVTIAYLLGGVMSQTLFWSGSLWGPIAAHALYDIAVLQHLAVQLRRGTIKVS